MTSIAWTFAEIAKAEVSVFVAAVSVVVLFRMLAQGPVLGSMIASRFGGPAHSERIFSLLATAFAAATYLHSILSSGGTLPEVPSSTLALLGAGHGTYLFGKHTRKR